MIFYIKSTIRKSQEKWILETGVLLVQNCYVRLDDIIAVDEYTYVFFLSVSYVSNVTFLVDCKGQKR